VLNTNAAGTVVGWFTRTFDGIVDAGGDGHWTTLQEGDDALDAGPYTMWVKQGIYAAGLTVTTDDAHIFVEPGTVIQAGITLSGDRPTLILGKGCDVQGPITLSGASPTLICLGACDIEGIVASGADYLIDGGGWDTISDGGIARHGINLTANGGICQNISARTTGGGGSAFHAVVASNRCTMEAVRVIDSDDTGMRINGPDVKLSGCRVEAADGIGIHVRGPRARVANNAVLSGVVGIGIQGNTNGDDSVYVGNISDSAGSALTLDAGADDSVVVGNRTDGAITDNSAGSTVASNNTAAF